MAKDVVFFSHSSRDKVALANLKKCFDDRTNGTVDVFLSSDGQSIRYGSNWVGEVEAALGAAKVMFVFVSPNSIASPWLYFESGHSRGKGIDVVPVGLFGVDIGALPPPLSQLQGFNLTDVKSMNNIIIKVNEVFGTKHKDFTEEDFARLEAEDLYTHSKLFGKHGHAIDYITLEITQPSPTLGKVLQNLSGRPGFMRTENGGCTFAGVNIWVTRQGDHGDPNHSMAYRIEVDPFSAEQTLPVVEEALADAFQLTAASPCTYRLSLRFDGSVATIIGSHRQMSRLVPPLARGADESGSASHVWLSWKGREFCVGARHPGMDDRTLQAEVALRANAFVPFHQAELGELLDLLFRRGVLSEH